MAVFVHAQGIKQSTQGGGVKKWQNSVHVVVECPLTENNLFKFLYCFFGKLKIGGIQQLRG